MSLSSRVFSFSLLAFFVFTVLLYLPGISGALYYDDYSNLKKLTSVNDFNSAIEFILSGRAGPLGRPVALLSFIPFAEAWPANASSMLFFNVVIHALNAVGLFFLGYFILLQKEISRDKAFLIALLAAWLWAVMPIVASTTLITIQRMTSLAALWGILGLVVYVSAYERYRAQPKIRLIVQLMAVVLGATLSVFTKENGVLIPVYALLIDVIFFNVSDDRYRYIRRAVLAIPLFIVLYYISPLNMDWFSIREYRGFSPLDRLLGETVILWDYVINGLLPASPNEFSPFHDQVGVYFPAWKIWAASCGWLTLIVLSICLLRVSKWPFFVVFWFLISHLLESTTVTLEPYFEHRNYLAFYGFALALTYWVWTSSYTSLKLGHLLYGVMLSAILLMVTSLWGQPLKAADVWAYTHPDSSRAVLHSVFLEQGGTQEGIADLNSEYIDRQSAIGLIAKLDRTSQACDTCVDTRMIAFLYSCRFEPLDSSQTRYYDLLNRAPESRLTENLSENVFALYDLAEKQVCSWFGFPEARALINGLLSNPLADSRLYGLKIRFVDAMIAEKQGRLNDAERTLSVAEKLEPRALPILQYQVYLYKLMNNEDKAQAAIERRMNVIQKRGATQTMDMLTLNKMMDSLHNE